MKIIYQSIILAAAALMSACGGGDDDEQSQVPDQPVAVTVSTLEGKLFAPDGSTPISNALVYVENSSPVTSMAARSAVLNVSCGVVPDSSWAYTCTDVDGSFKFTASIPSGGAQLVAKKGAFSAQAAVVPEQGETISLNLLISVEGPNVTRMAVVTGYYDSIQDILAKLGFGDADENGRLVVGSEEFDLFDGDGSLDENYKELVALLVDGDDDGRPDIYNYSIVFFNCGLTEIEASPENAKILRDYVSAGGRIYVSDQSYNLVEQVFPEYIQFEGAVSSDASEPEPMYAALIGQGGIEVSASLDSGLASWLGSVGCAGGNCLSENGTALIDGFLSSWAVMVGAHSAPPSEVKVWVKGPVAWQDSDGPIERPLTVSFNHGAGRVTYTSYHNEPEFNVPGGFVAVERILQFLVFEL